MSPAEQLKANRAIRDAAREDLETRLAQVKSDLEARGLGGRIADRISEEARETFTEALEIAEENKAVVAGTIGALGLWALRDPLLGWLGNRQGNPEEAEERHERGEGESETQ